MRNLRDLISEIHIFTSSLRGIESRDFVGWLSSRRSVQDLTVRDVYYICLGRLPEEASVATMRYNSATACANHIVECIVSDEFRKRLPELIFAALPELDRHFFVHIPRTGGTSLRRLTEQYQALLSWNESYADQEWFALGDSDAGGGERFMLRFLGQFGREPSPPFFYAGHTSMASLLSRRLIRPHDKAVAVLRDPIEMLISTVNYIFTVASRNGPTPDALEWTTWIRGMEPAWVAGQKPSADLIHRLVRDQRFGATYGDMMTRYLSIDGTVQGAIDGLAISQCRVIWLDEIGEYARDVLRINEPVPQENASTNFVADAAAFTPAVRTYMRKTLSAKDHELLSKLQDASLLRRVRGGSRRAAGRLNC